MVLGFLMDLWLGDPQAWWHPIRLVGRLIAACEGVLRRIFPRTKAGERAAGVALVALVLAVSAGVTLAVMLLLARVSIWLAACWDVLVCWLLLSAKSPKVESMRVYDALQAEDLPLAREMVGRIVGRDTLALDASQVASAAVETVAESTVDGIVAPMLYMAAGAAPLAMLYKATNTMDSMVGYKNDKYRYFGTAAARLDDVLGFVPARLGGVLLCMAAWLCGEDGRSAWRVFKRDRRAHASPNSAHGEAAVAGALGLELGGDACYFGQLHRKPTQGDGRRAQADDIRRANRLARATAWLMLVFGVAVRAIILICIQW